MNDAVRIRMPGGDFDPLNFVESKAMLRDIDPLNAETWRLKCVLSLNFILRMSLHT